MRPITRRLAHIMFCVTCKQNLELSAFKTLQGTQGVRVKSSCIACEKKRQAERYASPEGKAKADERRKNNIAARRIRARAYMKRMRAEKGENYRKYRAYLKNRANAVRALIRGSDASATIEDIRRIGESQKWLCVFCRKDIAVNYSIDHIRPISKGGDHSPMNIQLLCVPCNTKKGARENWFPNEDSHSPRLAVAA